MPKKQIKDVAVSDELQRNWGWLLALGIVFIMMGTLGLGMVVNLTLASMFFLGVMLIIAGIIQIIDVFKSRGWKGGATHALIALFYFAGGSLIIYDPLLASSVITIGLACVFIMMGLIRLYMALLLNEAKGWGWIVVSGIAATTLGILILLQWPVSGLWFIGLFVAIELIIAGWTYVFFAISIRKHA